MEDTTMIKKEYMQPTLEVIEGETEQMIASSVTIIISNGLSETDELNIDETSANPWEFAW